MSTVTVASIENSNSVVVVDVRMRRNVSPTYHVPFNKSCSKSVFSVEWVVHAVVLNKK